MSKYLDLISEEKQWDILKLTIERGDMQRLLKMLENGYKVTPALIELLRQLHYGKILAIIAARYAAEYNLWSIFEEIFGNDKLKKFQKRLENKKEKQKQHKTDDELLRFKSMLKKENSQETPSAELVGLALKLKKNGQRAPIDTLINVFNEENVYDTATQLFSVSSSDLAAIEPLWETDISKVTKNGECSVGYGGFSDKLLLDRENFLRVEKMLWTLAPNDEKLIAYCQKVLQHPKGIKALSSLPFSEVDKKLFLNFPQILEHVIKEGDFSRIFHADLMDFETWLQWYQRDPQQAVLYTKKGSSHHFTQKFMRLKIKWYFLKKGKISLALTL